jgi:ELWxxDGT repeat protein
VWYKFIIFKLNRLLKFMMRLLLTLIFFPGLLAAQVSLVKDIYVGHTDSFGGDPNHLIVYKGATLFALSDGDFGRELWKTDGTPAGTIMLKDISPGSFSSNPSKFIEVDNILYFVANDAAHGPELWRTDGTEEGTRLVKDINPGMEGSNITWITNVGSKIYLFASDGEHGNELWKSDGTEVGTVMVKDIYPGKAHSGIYAFNEYKGMLFMSADDGEHGRELWRSDGTVDGTFMVLDIEPGLTESSPEEFEVFQNKLYISVPGSGIWRSDGTAVGTALVMSMFYSGSVYTYSNLTAGASHLYFHAHSEDLACKLFQYDGNDEVVLDDFYYMGENGAKMFEGLSLVEGNIMYSYAMFTSSDFGATYQVTVSLKYINDVSGNTIFEGSSFDLIQGSIEFMEQSYQSKLWKGSGTSYYWGISQEGTAFYKKENGNPFTIFQAVNFASPYVYYNDHIVIGTDLQDGKGRELYKSSGELQPWIKLHETEGPESSYPSLFTELNGLSLFSAYDPVNGYALWKSDGTPDGTLIVKGTDFSVAEQPVVIGNKAIFVASAFGEGRELWESNGTAAGTKVLKEIMPGTDGSEPSNFVKVNNKFLFTAGDPTLGFSLWSTDGTTAGTLLIKDLRPGDTDMLGNFVVLASSGTILYFEWDDGITGRGIWKSDGTAAGTQFVKSVTVNDSHATVMNGVLYFNGYTAANGEELWRSDGTDAGTYLLKEFLTGPQYTSPRNFTTHNNKVIFTLGGSQVWATDGTEPGTILVKDFTPVISNGYYKPSWVDYLTLYKGKVFFFNLREMWSTDGTPAGTKFITEAKDPSGFFSGVNETKVVGNHLFFLLNGADMQYHIWITDGTSARTERLPSIISPVVLGLGTLNNDYLIDGAGPEGYELWKLKPKQGQVITFPVLADVAYGTAPYNPGASSNAGLDITYTSSNPSLVEIVDGKITIKGVGQVTITATQGGSEQFWSAAPVQRTLKVIKANQVITFEDFPLKKTTDLPFEIPASTNSTLPLSFSTGDAGIASIAGNIITIHEAGTVTITASQAGDANYNAAPAVSKQLTVELVVGIESLLAGFNVHPNPTTGIVNIESPLPIQEVQLIDVVGKVHNGFPVNENQINIANLPSGIYFVRVKAGSASVQMKISKQ